MIPYICVGNKKMLSPSSSTSDTITVIYPLRKGTSRFIGPAYFTLATKEKKSNWDPWEVSLHISKNVETQVESRQPQTPGTLRHDDFQTVLV